MAELTSSQSGSRVFRKKMGNTRPPVRPSGVPVHRLPGCTVLLAEPVEPGSTSPVRRFLGCTVLAQGTRPLVASPAGNTPLELAASVSAAKP
eukprot:5394962-Amphidinium_carterae.1